MQRIPAKRIATLTAIIALTFNVSTAAAFSDIPNTHDNYVAITYLNEQGIVSGYEDGTYKPNQIVNRAEALKIILEGKDVEIREDLIDINYSDVTGSDWFTKYVMTATNLGIVGGNPDGTFAPGREVARAEFLKMLLNASNFNASKWEGIQMFPDIPSDQWYTPFMNYAGQAGIINKNENGNLKPAEALGRGEVAEILYLMTVILKGTDTQFLISQAETQMAQIDIYVNAENPLAAKRAAELSVDMTQQAYKNLPDNNVVLGAAKLARAYDFLVNSYVTGLQDSFEESRDWANQAIDKATEAWEVNNEIQPIASHIKARAQEIIDQLPAA